MPGTIIVRSRYGSQGKGKVTSLLTRDLENLRVVRCGGPSHHSRIAVKVINGDETIKAFPLVFSGRVDRG